MFYRGISLEEYPEDPKKYKKFIGSLKKELKSTTEGTELIIPTPQQLLDPLYFVIKRLINWAEQPLFSSSIYGVLAPVLPSYFSDFSRRVREHLSLEGERHGIKLITLEDAVGELLDVELPERKEGDYTNDILYTYDTEQNLVEFVTRVVEAEHYTTFH